VRRLYLIYDLLQFRVDPQILLVFGVPFAQFWSIFVQFWSIIGPLGTLPISEMRFSSLLRFESDGRSAFGTPVGPNTVLVFQVRQAHDATWEHCLSVPRATPEVVLVHFSPKSSLWVTSSTPLNLAGILITPTLLNILRPAYTTSPNTSIGPRLHEIRHSTALERSSAPNRRVQLCPPSHTPPHITYSYEPLATLERPQN
jgi:hypothetical protein